MKFYELAIGAVFNFRGKRYEKTAIPDRRHRDLPAVGTWYWRRRGGDEPFLPAEVAAEWKPSEVYWADRLEPAPGQGSPDCQTKVKGLDFTGGHGANGGQ